MGGEPKDDYKEVDSCRENKSVGSQKRLGSGAPTSGSSPSSMFVRPVTELLSCFHTVFMSPDSSALLIRATDDSISATERLRVGEAMLQRKGGVRKRVRKGLHLWKTQGGQTFNKSTGSLRFWLKNQRFYLTTPRSG